MDLKGKVALITGADSGMGAATARRFVAEGAKVCINDIDGDKLEEVARSLPADMVVSCAGDVSKLKDVERMVDTAVSFGGKLNVLVNSAGIDPPGGGEKIDLEIWHKIIEVDLTGPYLTMKTAIPHMIKAGGGSIINIASLAGVRFVPGKVEYCAAKGGLVALSQQVGVEYGKYNIRSNVICPGGTKTPMLVDHILPRAQKLGKDVDWMIAQMTSGTPLGRIAQPEEIAGICYFLASDDSSLINAGIIMADGGAAAIDVNIYAMRGNSPKLEADMAADTK